MTITETNPRLVDAVATALRPVYPPVVAADGASITLADGRTVTDLAGQTLNLPLGQGLPSILGAAVAQAQAVQFASSRFGTEPFLALSRRLADLAPEGMNAVILKLTNGSDAVETAIKIAWLHTRRTRIGHLPGAWHGESFLTLGLATTHRGRLLAADGHVAAESAEISALARLVLSRQDLAGVIVDPAMVSNGLPADGIEQLRRDLAALRRACDATGTLLIFDEIQTFGGWLGSALFASEWAWVRPDLICLGKALGGGFPLAAVVCRTEMAAVLQYNDAEFTYGGHPVACAAALAALDELGRLRDGLDDRATMMADLLRVMFPAGSFEVRQVGLIATVAPRATRLREVWTARLAAACMQAGLFVRPTDHGRRLILKPPLVLPAGELAGALAEIGRHARDVQSGLRRVRPAQDAGRVAAHELAGWLLRRPARPDRIAEPAVRRLCAADPGLTVVAREPSVQEELSRRLRAVGVPAVALYAAPGRDAVDYDYLPGRTLRDVLADPDTDDALLNGLTLRAYEALVTAHDQGILVGICNPGRMIVTGRGDLRLVDLELGCVGPTSAVTLVEETSLVVDLLAAIPPGHPIGDSLSRRLLAAVADRHNHADLLVVWERLRGYYGDTAASGDPLASPAIYTRLLASAIASLRPIKS
ncbi:conserved hypothetical protein [Frankia sp. AiPs1]|uniref:aminotransferase class III-fold pyridoxal phosphate-dependent enzyme n=1 Tax=Frankia sp. AiPa1 TaxID=573492 RepID=UPI00202B256A|nr:aminotransferase class III-fold pyridoxal phosphate-dependent enzyme [Frankia sp. AiPa1]MCL9759251.1 aminotransferase class III-fold pyridoxal phosphate-dependent enzyme [Frankia sp. AiPa1]